MGEAWRRKAYYRPRVLIETEHVLTPLFGDSVVCLTGGELYMLRAMCQYLHRRSTFVTQYEQQYYLAPTEEEWDELDGVVAELEGKLMNCEDFTALLEQIAECVCATAKQVYHGEPAGEGQEDYDDYTSPVEEGEGDPPGEFEDWDDWRVSKCKSAQKYIDDMIDVAERWTVWYTAGGAATFAILNTLLLPTTIAPPLMVVILLVEALLTYGADLMGEEVEAWLTDHKSDLVCAIYTAPTTDAAKSALQDYVDAEWDCVAGPQAVQYLWGNRALSRVFDGTMPNYEVWQADYSASYCALCSGWIQGSGWFAVPCTPEQDWYAEKAPPTGYLYKCLPRFGNIGAMWCGIVIQTTGETGFGYWRLDTVQAGSCPNQDFNAWATFQPNFTMGKYLCINGTNVDEAAIAAYFGATQYQSTSIYRRSTYVDGCIELKSYTGKPKTTLQCLYLIFEGTIP